MEIGSALGRTINQIWIFRTSLLHPAWIDANTLPIVAVHAFLEFGDGTIAKVSPCEINLSPDKYPSLGLELHVVERAALQFSHGDRIIRAVPLSEAASFLPFVVAGVECSDPLEEGAVSQYLLRASGGQIVILRHIMPPITLGISVEAG